MTGTAIAPAGREAADILAELHARSFDEVWDAATFGQLLALPGSFALLAIAGDTPAGFIMMRVAADEAEILTLAVDPEKRRAGTGRTLLDAGLALAREMGAVKAFLEVSERNAAAIALYTGAGWQETGRRARYYADGSDALMLSVSLA
ncbi:ribosomal protein S18-alanine N-acetyltransferase [Glycocaulis sp.]|mgnify:CR=1 FL=1